MENFWGSLKNKLVHHCSYTTRDEAKASIQENIEVFYNRQRRHSRLGYLSPTAFEANYYQLKEAALVGAVYC
jgi:transposase InsO family protein